MESKEEKKSESGNVIDIVQAVAEVLEIEDVQVADTGTIYFTCNNLNIRIADHEQLYAGADLSFINPTAEEVIDRLENIDENSIDELKAETAREMNYQRNAELVSERKDFEGVGGYSGVEQFLMNLKKRHDKYIGSPSHAGTRKQLKDKIRYYEYLQKKLDYSPPDV